MPTDFLSLGTPFWLLICSYVAKSLPEAIDFCDIANERMDGMLKLINGKSLALDDNDIKHGSLALFKPLWDDLKRHFSLLKAKTSPKEALDFHLSKSLKYLDWDFNRTDQLLFHLTKGKGALRNDVTFDPENGQDFDLFTDFILGKLNDNGLYANLNLTKLKLSVHPGVKSLSQWVKEFYGPLINPGWLRVKLLARFEELILDADLNDPSGRLKRRLKRFKSIFTNYCDYIASVTLPFIFLMFGSFFFAVYDALEPFFPYLQDPKISQYFSVGMGIVASLIPEKLAKLIWYFFRIEGLCFALTLEKSIHRGELVLYQILDFIKVVFLSIVMWIVSLFMRLFGFCPIEAKEKED